MFGEIEGRMLARLDGSSPVGAEMVYNTGSSTETSCRRRFPAPPTSSSMNSIGTPRLSARASRRSVSASSSNVSAVKPSSVRLPFTVSRVSCTVPISRMIGSELRGGHSTRSDCVQRISCTAPSAQK
eukprot:scaffold1302_cov245-Pinguiococcus_pyrenoidosus.AAC.3